MVRYVQVESTYFDGIKAGAAAADSLRETNEYLTKQNSSLLEELALSEEHYEELAEVVVNLQENEAEILTAGAAAMMESQRETIDAKQQAIDALLALNAATVSYYDMVANMEETFEAVDAELENLKAVLIGSKERATEVQFAPVEGQFSE